MCLWHNTSARFVYVPFVLTFFCCFCSFIADMSDLWKFALRTFFFLRWIKARNPERARWAHVGCSSSRSEHMQDSGYILPTGAVSYVIKKRYHVFRLSLLRALRLAKTFQILWFYVSYFENVNEIQQDRAIKQDKVKLFLLM